MSATHTGDVATALTPSTRQMLFIRYFTAILVDLVVLNILDEYWHRVEIESFTVSLFAAVMLQVLLQLTLKLEHALADWFKSKSGTLFTILRWVSTWLVLFVSKFVILFALNVTFGDGVHFGGPLHGVVAFIVAVVLMLAAEEAVVRFVRRIA
jgi:hypothetical protein